MKQLGQDEAMDSRENQIMSTLMLLLADSLENKYNLLNKFAIMNVFFFCRITGALLLNIITIDKIIKIFNHVDC